MKSKEKSLIVAGLLLAQIDNGIEVGYILINRLEFLQGDFGLLLDVVVVIVVLFFVLVFFTLVFVFFCFILRTIILNLKLILSSKLLW